MPEVTPMWVCTECGELHRACDGECMYECTTERVRTYCNCMVPFEDPPPMMEHADNCPVTKVPLVPDGYGAQVKAEITARRATAKSRVEPPPTSGQKDAPA